MERVKDDIGYDIEEAAKVKPAELARGGYTKVQKTLSKLVNEKRANILKASLSEEGHEWLMTRINKEIGEGGPSPGASDWVTVTPTNPTTTLSDSDFRLSSRARFQFPHHQARNPMCMHYFLCP